MDANASEEDKIKAMMTQSNHEYDPIKLVYTHFAFGLVLIITQSNIMALH